MGGPLDSYKTELEQQIATAQAKLAALTFDSGRIVQFTKQYVNSMAEGKTVVDTVYAWEKWKQANP